MLEICLLVDESADLEKIFGAFLDKLFTRTTLCSELTSLANCELNQRICNISEHINKRSKNF